MFCIERDNCKVGAFLLINTLLIIAALISFSLIVIYLKFLRETRKTNKIWHLLETSPNNTTFTTEMFAELPQPVRGIIPVVNAQNQDITRSGIGRLAGESFWLPSALLPQNGVNWQAIDNNTIEAFK